MRIIEALGALQFLKKELLNFADIGTALGVSRAAISNRHQNSNKGYDVLKKEEIEKLENYFDVSFNMFNVPQFEQVKDDLAQRMEKMENALKNAGILKD